ncbi:adenine deaminase C-terminal domain-containing protein [Aureibacillus halotolerans]|uniref:adenine deaminase n=1 Tax=Aureibacillus halotolerans TaxID=1508390 RepID=A0A4R6TUH9_9BACI|nr:adenine deaminase C-terminal domain-containing protein [Aureibacillus halotolerans]TDQ34156.1 adenine deaminase [Aureibacillus halotolerans]
MPQQRYRWRNRQIRQHIAAVSGKKAPSIVLQNATYLNFGLRQWLTANIWILHDRIVYVGPDMPEKTNDQTEIVDCKGQYVVPGYIEPHVHPFHVYNPHSFAYYACRKGTSVLVADNLFFALRLRDQQAFQMLSDLADGPASLFWWCRFDSQTEVHHEEEIFSNAMVKNWLENENVLLGGELTSWPQILEGDDMALHWIQECRRLHKQVEGHFPGASEKTLTKMALLGVKSDHEAITGKDVYNRLKAGYHVTLRYSSIRPDLPHLLDEMHELGVHYYENLSFTTDGSPPAFYEHGMIDRLIKIAIEKGVPVIDAYAMGTYNPARHFRIEDRHGAIAPGQVANINILTSPEEPAPISVITKGKWFRRDDKVIAEWTEFNWSQYGLSSADIDWELTSDDLQFSMPLGLEMKNSVIMHPYSVTTEVSVEQLPEGSDECFLILIDRHGKWRVNTVLKGFANSLGGFASTFSSTGDLFIIGQNKKDMKAAFDVVKEMKGGLALVENGNITFKMELELEGIMSNKRLKVLGQEEQKLTNLLKDRGYAFDHPLDSLLFFSATHLPYIRVTPQGIFDVMKKTVLFPSIMR